MDVAVIGGGPGGYSAALYCARSGYSVVVIERLSPGGQMATTGQVDNYPGFDEGIDGFELEKREGCGALRRCNRLCRCCLNNLEAQPKRIETTSGVFTARAVVLATGAVARKLEVEGEDRRPRSCLLCHLRRYALPRQNRCCSRRREQCGYRCALPLENLQKGLSFTPPGYPPSV